MKILFLLFALLFILPVLPASMAAEAPGKPAQISTALAEKMIRLNRAYRDIVTAVVNDDGERVSKLIASIEGIFEKTREDLEKGKLTLKKNPDKIKEFLQMDRELQKNLEALASAAKANDTQKMVAMTKKILDNCVGCHLAFRVK